MTGFKSSLYLGAVVHKRLTPKRHAFSYRVFSLCLDVDEIEQLDRQLRLFSRNAWNVLSFWDRDLGNASAETVGEKARNLLADAGLQSCGHRIELVCYPRVLGYAFNPICVYFCHDEAGRLGAIIYEVSNTFRERRAYVIEVPNRASETIAQACTKELYVSPFTSPAGAYSFHVRPPGEDLVVGVAFRDAKQAVLKTHFRAKRIPLSDGSILRLLAGNPMMTIKVIGAIHLEAARLWIKGVPITQRYASDSYAATVVRSQLQEVRA